VAKTDKVVIQAIQAKTASPAIPVKMVNQDSLDSPDKMDCLVIQDKTVRLVSLDTLV